MSRNADRAIRHHRAVVEAMAKLSPTMIAEIMRRAGKREHDAKGSERVSVAKGSVSDPTMSKVIERITAEEEGFESHDALFEAGRDFALTMSELEKLSIVALEKARFVLEVQERTKKASTANCNACRREVACTLSDPIKSGYCDRDYRRWLRAGRPNRLQFEAEIWAETNDLQSVHQTD